MSSIWSGPLFIKEMYGNKNVFFGRERFRGWAGMLANYLLLFGLKAFANERNMLCQHVRHMLRSFVHSVGLCCMLAYVAPSLKPVKLFA